jgi:membrane-bound lytic murein transglycosylase D
MSHQLARATLCGFLLPLLLEGGAHARPPTHPPTAQDSSAAEGGVAPVGEQPVEIIAGQSSRTGARPASDRSDKTPEGEPAKPASAPGAAKPPTSPAPISDDLTELRKFEESAFPRASTREPRQGVVPALEGPPPPSTAPRPSAEAPPQGLRSQEHGTNGTATRVLDRLPEPWLSRLVLPDIPVRWDPKVLRYLEFYRSSAAGRAIMSTWLRRMGRYEKLIRGALRRNGLPQALIFLAMVESGFNPRVTSRVGAAGVWQFMYGPGTGYGLLRDHWVDERRNPEKSTEAALRYLKDLHDRFGTWELALAGYNAGHGAVLRAIQKYNTNDYWQICRYEAGLPWETALYVPKILAVAIVASNRSFFGFEGVKPEAEIPIALVSVPTSITLAQAASAAGISKDAMEQLNPELRRGRTPPVAKAWLRVPQGGEDRFYAGLAAMKGQLARYKPYVTRLGDSAKDLARAHRITAATLRSLNGLERDEHLRPGVTILVPARAPAEVPLSASAEGQEHSEGKPGSVEQDEPILVPLPEDRPSSLPGRQRVFYRVAPGDTVDEIAHGLGVKTEDIAGWNSIDGRAKLIPGMVLQAFVAQTLNASQVVLLDPQRIQVMVAGSDEFYNAYEQRRGRKRMTYTVRDGDTISSVGRRFGLSPGSVMRINRLDRRANLRPGQTLVVYVELAKLQTKRPAAGKPSKKRPRSAAADEEQTGEASEASTRADPSPTEDAADAEEKKTAPTQAKESPTAASEEDQGAVDSKEPVAVRNDIAPRKTRPARRHRRPGADETTTGADN